MGQCWTSYESYKKYDVLLGEYAWACLEGPKLATANLPGYRDMMGGYRITRHIPDPDRYYCLGLYLFRASLVISLSRAFHPRVDLRARRYPALPALRFPYLGRQRRKATSGWEWHRFLLWLISGLQGQHHLGIFYPSPSGLYGSKYPISHAIIISQGLSADDVGKDAQLCKPLTHQIISPNRYRLRCIQ